MFPSPPQSPADAMRTSLGGALSDLAIAGAAEVLADDPRSAGDFDGLSDPIDRFPAWLAGGIIVAISSVFWVGLITIAGWVF